MQYLLTIRYIKCHYQATQVKKNWFVVLGLFCWFIHIPQIFKSVVYGRCDPVVWWVEHIASDPCGIQYIK